jgi:hypothetical protein
MVLNLTNKPEKGYIRSTDYCDAVNWALCKVGQKYLDSSEMWCWRRTEKISWTDRVRNEVVQRAKEETNILKTIRKEGSLNGFGHILHMNCLLKHVTEEKTEGRI